MELINRYVYQVGRRLPRKVRGDVETELRSLLIDALEERVASGSDADAEFNEADPLVARFGSGKLDEVRRGLLLRTTAAEKAEISEYGLRVDNAAFNALSEKSRHHITLVRFT